MEREPFMSEGGFGTEGSEGTSEDGDRPLSPRAERLSHLRRTPRRVEPPEADAEVRAPRIVPRRYEPRPETTEEARARTDEEIGRRVTEEVDRRMAEDRRRAEEETRRRADDERRAEEVRRRPERDMDREGEDEEYRDFRRAHRGDREREGRMERPRTLMEEFALLAGKPDEAWDKLEGLIRLAEVESVKFDENTFRSVDYAISEGLSSEQALAQKMIVMLTARYLYHNASFACESADSELLKGMLNPMRKVDHQVILELPGVRSALAVLQSTEAQNDYFREQDADSRNSWLRQKKIDLVVPGEGYNRDNIIAAFERMGSGLTPESAAEVILGEGVSAETVKRFGKILYEANRAYDLAMKAINFTGYASSSDGPKWKNTTREMTESGVSDEAGFILVNPEIEHIDPVTHRRLRVNLRTAANSTDEAVQRTLADYKKRCPQEIAVAWDRAWRDLFNKHYDDIDFENSTAGAAPLLLKRLSFLPTWFEKTTNPYRGRAAYLRRFTYVNVPPTLMAVENRKSIEDALDNWKKEGDFGILLTWTGRAVGADKIRKIFAEEEPTILSNAPLINSPELEAIKALKDAFSYLPENEREEVASTWTEGFITTMRHFNKQYFDFSNIGDVSADTYIRNAHAKGYIVPEKRDELLNREIGPGGWRDLKIFTKRIRWLAALWTFITGLAKSSAPSAR